MSNYICKLDGMLKEFTFATVTVTALPSRAISTFPRDWIRDKSAPPWW